MYKCILMNIYTGGVICNVRLNAASHVYTPPGIYTYVHLYTWGNDWGAMTAPAWVKTAVFGSFLVCLCMLMNVYKRQTVKFAMRPLAGVLSGVHQVYIENQCTPNIHLLRQK